MSDLDRLRDARDRLERWRPEWSGGAQASTWESQARAVHLFDQTKAAIDEAWAEFLRVLVGHIEGRP